MHLQHQQAVLPVPQYQRRAEAWMRQALALLPTHGSDVPVAALVVDEAGQILGSGINKREASGDPTAHAEVLAIREAVQHRGGGWRLSGCTLVVTLEPCAMCAGAILNSRIGTVLFGAFEEKTGACGSVVDLLRDPALHPTPQVYGGVLEAQCAQVLQDFFAELRD